MAETMPAIFIGHGTPMNALTKNSYTAGWASLGKTLPRPKAILAVSAHWYIQGCAVTVNAAPPTIHDFGGFPKELYEIQYPAPGSPELARQVRDLLSPVPVGLDESWGIDHGTWSVLVHLFPNANIPVVQLSIDSRQAPFFHYELGKRLMSLREEGILILGSGNVVHNLSAYVWGDSAAPAFDWAMRFENRVRQLVQQEMLPGWSIIIAWVLTRCSPFRHRNTTCHYCICLAFARIMNRSVFRSRESREVRFRCLLSG